jgi:hypothetical protein
MDAAGISAQELFHGGHGFASNAHDFHTVVLIQLVSDRCFGQERLALHQAGNRVQKVGGHSDGHSCIRRAAIGKIWRQRSRADQNKSREHAGSKAQCVPTAACRTTRAELSRRPRTTG